MSSVLELPVDSEAFALGRTLDGEFDVTIALERFEGSVGSDPTVEETHRHLRPEDAALPRAQWAGRVRSLLYSVAEGLGIRSSSAGETPRRTTAELGANALLEKRTG